MANLRATTIQGDFKAQDTIVDLNSQFLNTSDDPETAIVDFAGVRIGRGSAPASTLYWNENVNEWQLGIEGDLSRILTEEDISDIIGEVAASSIGIEEGLNIDLLFNASTGGTIVSAVPSGDNGDFQINNNGLFDVVSDGLARHDLQFDAYTFGHRQGGVGTYSVVLGSSLETPQSPAEASGDYSFAVGRLSTATGVESVAMTRGTASGDRSVAFHGGEASGTNSSNFGAGSSISSGTSSFVSGNSNEAQGDFSSAFGMGLFAKAQSSFVVGKFNLGNSGLNGQAPDDKLFVVGTGTSGSNRNDGFYVDYDNVVTNQPLQVDDTIFINSTGSYTDGYGFVKNQDDETVVSFNEIGVGFSKDSADFGINMNGGRLVVDTLGAPTNLSATPNVTGSTEVEYLVVAVDRSGAHTNAESITISDVPDNTEAYGVISIGDVSGDTVIFLDFGFNASTSINVGDQFTLRYMVRDPLTNLNFRFSDGSFESRETTITVDSISGNEITIQESLPEIGSVFGYIIEDGATDKVDISWDPVEGALYYAVGKRIASKDNTPKILERTRSTLFEDFTVGSIGGGSEFENFIPGSSGAIFADDWRNKTGDVFVRGHLSVGDPEENVGTSTNSLPLEVYHIKPNGSGDTQSAVSFVQEITEKDSVLDSAFNQTDYTLFSLNQTIEPETPGNTDSGVADTVGMGLSISTPLGIGAKGIAMGFDGSFEDLTGVEVNFGDDVTITQDSSAFKADADRFEDPGFRTYTAYEATQTDYDGFGNSVWHGMYVWGVNSTNYFGGRISIGNTDSDDQDFSYLNIVQHETDSNDYDYIFVTKRDPVNKTLFAIRRDEEIILNGDTTRILSSTFEVAEPSQASDLSQILVRNPTTGEIERVSSSQISSGGSLAIEAGDNIESVLNASTGNLILSARPSGNNQEIQFNDQGTFGATQDLRIDTSASDTAIFLNANVVFQNGTGDTPVFNGSQTNVYIGNGAEHNIGRENFIIGAHFIGDSGGFLGPIESFITGNANSISASFDSYITGDGITVGNSSLAQGPEYSYVTGNAYTVLRSNYSFVTGNSGELDEVEYSFASSGFSTDATSVSASVLLRPGVLNNVNRSVIVGNDTDASNVNDSIIVGEGVGVDNIDDSVLIASSMDGVRRSIVVNGSSGLTNSDGNVLIGVRSGSYDNIKNSVANMDLDGKGQVFDESLVFASSINPENSISYFEKGQVFGVNNRIGIQDISNTFVSYDSTSNILIIDATDIGDDFFNASFNYEISLDGEPFVEVDESNTEFNASTGNIEVGFNSQAAPSDIFQFENPDVFVDPRSGFSGGKSISIEVHGISNVVDHVGKRQYTSVNRPNNIYVYGKFNEVIFSTYNEYRSQVNNDVNFGNKFVFGEGLFVDWPGEIPSMTIGQFNEKNGDVPSDPEYLFVVGNGQNNNSRSNAMTIVRDGTTTVNNLNIENVPTDNTATDILVRDSNGDVRKTEISMVTSTEVETGESLTSSINASTGNKIIDVNEDGIILKADNGNRYLVDVTGDGNLRTNLVGSGPSTPGASSGFEYDGETLFLDQQTGQTDPLLITRDTSLNNLFSLNVDGDAEFYEEGKGIILVSPDGNERKRVRLGNDGLLKTEDV